MTEGTSKAQKIRHAAIKDLVEAHKEEYAILLAKHASLYTPATAPTSVVGETIQP